MMKYTLKPVKCILPLLSLSVNPINTTNLICFVRGTNRESLVSCYNYIDNNNKEEKNRGKEFENSTPHVHVQTLCPFAQYLPTTRLIK